MSTFYGEKGVQRHIGRVKGDCDDKNAWERRNYSESSYLSGLPKLEPGEYPVRADFYKAYRLDEDSSKPL